LKVDKNLSHSGIRVEKMQTECKPAKPSRASAIAGASV
jgi:hypothetical protein